jgi:hypothetical protein
MGKVTQLIDKDRLKGEFMHHVGGAEVLDTKALKIIDRQPIQAAITYKDLINMSKIIYDDDGIGHKVVELKDILKEE